MVLSPESELLHQVKQPCMNSQPGKNYAPRSTIPENLFWLLGSDAMAVFSLEGTKGIWGPLHCQQMSEAKAVLVIGLTLCIIKYDSINSRDR